MATSETKSKLEEGPCGRFRFQVIPDPITVGVLFLERKRPWPKCTNPETGKQWGDDMKQKVSKIPKKRLIVEIPYIMDLISNEDVESFLPLPFSDY